MTVRKLRLNFHGRIIDHLGIQMYQSPIAAVAEMVSNSWDADAENVWIELPIALDSDSTLTIKDDGTGMTLQECQERYLAVGYDRRDNNADAKTLFKLRPVLGRKGIGKFAGFGIAEVIHINTISQVTGEETKFELDLNEIRSNRYEFSPKDIDVLEYIEPNEDSKQRHGTTITLRRLLLKRGMAADAYRRSMSRRFLLQQRVSDFRIYVNDLPLPDTEDFEKIEFSYPKDYDTDGYSSKPQNLSAINEDGWGTEKLSDGRVIKWRFLFYEVPIDEEELRGIAIFAKMKLAQTPFFFNLVGGLSGQHGLEYLSGQVEADFIDTLPQDVIATERQRVNWEHKDTVPLLEWGQARVQELLRVWQKRRAEEKVQLLKERLEPFGNRLEKLQKHERRTIETSLQKLAQISTLSNSQYRDMGMAILTAWDAGRLRELIDSIANTEDMSEKQLLDILLEAKVLTALHTAESVKAKLDTIRGLEGRIRKRELELAVRDYVAESPWLISPEWETFRVERNIDKLLEDARLGAGIERDVDWTGRVDLALSSGNSLLILEFMKPGLKVDFDHVSRFERYVFTVRSRMRANTGTDFHTVTGYIVADKLNQDSTMLEKIQSMKNDKMYALDWESLLSKASAQWKEFLNVLIERVPNDDRLQELSDEN